MLAFWLAFWRVPRHLQWSTVTAVSKNQICLSVSRQGGLATCHAIGSVIKKMMEDGAKPSQTIAIPDDFDHIGES